MSYLTIGGTQYRVRIDGSSGRRIQIENRFRAMDGSLVVSRLATKKEVTVEIIGPAAGGGLSISAADSLMATLTGGNVSVAGDVGSLTAAARDVGYRDVKASGGTFRFVTATLEQV